MTAELRYAAKLEAIATEFEQHPQRWTRGASARNLIGGEVGAHDVSAVSWCQAGRRDSLDIRFETEAAVNAAALELGAVPDNYLTCQTAGIIVNDKMGREATIAMLRRAAQIMRGVAPAEENPRIVALQWAIFVGAMLGLGALGGHLGRVWGLW